MLAQIIENTNRFMSSVSKDKRKNMDNSLQICLQLTLWHLCLILIYRNLILIY